MCLSGKNAGVCKIKGDSAKGDILVNYYAQNWEKIKKMSFFLKQPIK